MKQAAMTIASETRISESAYAVKPPGIQMELAEVSHGTPIGGDRASIE